MKLVSWKEDFEGRLDSSGISFLEVSNEEECVASKHADDYEDKYFSLNEGCKVAKLQSCKVAKFFLGKKESNKEKKVNQIY